METQTQRILINDQSYTTGKVSNKILVVAQSDVDYNGSQHVLSCFAVSRPYKRALQPVLWSGARELKRAMWNLYVRLFVESRI